MIDHHTNGAVPHYSSASALGPPCSREPLAIVGIGCRFPGKANDPSRFWELLSGRRGCGHRGAAGALEQKIILRSGNR